MDICSGVDAKCAKTEVLGISRGRLGVDLLSVGCRLKSPQLYVQCAGCVVAKWRSRQRIVYQDYWGHMCWISLDLCFLSERKWPWLSVSTDMTLQGRFLWIKMRTPALHPIALEPRTMPTQSFIMQWNWGDDRWLSWSRAMSVLSLLKWQRILSLLMGGLSPFTFQEVIFIGGKLLGGFGLVIWLYRVLTWRGEERRRPGDELLEQGGIHMVSRWCLSVWCLTGGIG